MSVVAIQEVKVSFQARRLRVQLPCGDQTVVEAQVLQPTPTACPFATCGFVTPATICHNYLSNCGIVSQCHLYHSIHPTTCVGGHITLVTCPLGSCQCSITVHPTTTICPGGSIDPTGPIQVDPEVLPQLREQLEAQLEEIGKAEQALKEREE